MMKIKLGVIIIITIIVDLVLAKAGLGTIIVSPDSISVICVIAIALIATGIDEQQT